MLYDINQDSSKISDLRKKKSILSSDYIFMDVVDSNGNVKTVKIRYKEFKKCMANRLEGKFIFGSMAHEKKEDYAKFAHGHNYSYFQFYNAYGTGSLSSSIPVEDCYIAGSVTTINGESSVKFKQIANTMYIPMYYDGSQSESDIDIGTVQFLLVDDFEEYLKKYRKQTLADFNGKTNVDIKSDGFDGFVIPNGTTYNCLSDEFQEVCRVFSSNGDPHSTQFTIPDLSGLCSNSTYCNGSTDCHTQVPALMYIGDGK